LFVGLSEPVLIALWAFLIILMLALLSVALIVRWCLTCILGKVGDFVSAWRRTR
jgi:uncharacterized membrane protein